MGTTPQTMSRRTEKDRRVSSDPSYKGPQRRTSHGRRLNRDHDRMLYAYRVT